ncbi:hypothetical protein R8N68_25425, partial [Vibrio sp. 1974]|uniref:hypothetical protein n=1 Tax=Vibrio sp. 1974 TaxID=3074584 RepID=UPI002966C676
STSDRGGKFGCRFTLYVASTRAMRILALNSAVEMVIRYITQKRMVEKQMKMAAEATEVEEDTTK